MVAGDPAPTTIPFTYVKTSFARGTTAPLGALPVSSCANVDNFTVPKLVAVATAPPPTFHIPAPVVS